MRTRTDNKGFTIIELMIATTVFGFILLMLSSAILYMTKQYQHSLYVSNTQAAASNVIQTVAAAVKYSKYNSSIVEQNVSGTNVFCLGSRKLVVTKYKQLKSAITNPATTTTNAVVTSYNDTCNTTPAADKTELLGEGMRVSKLDIKQKDDVVTVAVRVVYGDDDLLCSETKLAGSCTDPAKNLNPAAPATDFQTGDLACKVGKGSEYCAVSELTTTIRVGL